MASSDLAGEWTRDFTEEEVAQEKAHIQRIINAFLSYRYQYSLQLVDSNTLMHHE